MEYMTIREAAAKWGITERRIQVLCSSCRLPGATKFGRQWAIPANLPKPLDERIKSGRYQKGRIMGKDGTNSSHRRKKVIFSFFSGTGFLDLGFETSGFDIDFVNEFHPAFMDAYKYSRTKMQLREPKYGYFQTDINNFLKSSAADLSGYIEEARKDGSLIGFIGGPPCPDFSVAGKNRGRDGDNGRLSKSYVDLIVKMKPDFFLFENVKGLWRTARHRAFFEELKVQLHSAGYVTTERLTNALEYGVPQDRDRILLFGVQKNILQTADINVFNWEKYHRYSLTAVKEFPWPSTSPFEADTPTDCPVDIPKELTVQYWFEKNDVEHHPNSADYFTPRSGISRMKTVDEGDSSRKSYKRLHRWRYSPTVAYGNNEVHLHPYRLRRISAAEAMALQSLPRSFELPPLMTLTNKFKTIGNGVPFLLARGIANTIADFLDQL